MNEHFRSEDDAEAPRVHSRKYDHGKMNKMNKFLDDFKIIWIIGFPLLVAFGFNFRTPGSQFKELHENQSEIKSRLVESNKVLAVLVFLKCEEVRTEVTKNRIVEFQLNCVEVFKDLNQK